jgi:large subunit ribosomal protein L21
LEIGTPLVKGSKVVGKILKQGKGKKIIVFKYKPKIRYKKKRGHRQPFTQVKIVKIEL